MSSLGALLLQLRGITDPKSQLMAQMLNNTTTPGAMTPGSPTSAAAAGGAASGVATPGGAPPAPAVSPVYQSPPDLLSLYTQLSDYAGREKRIDSGLSLLGGSIVHPENKALVAQAFGGGGEPSAGDTLQTILQLQTYKQQQDELQRQKDLRERMNKSVPAIAQEFGLPVATVQEMADNGKLEELILQQTKPEKGNSTTVNVDTAGEGDFGKALTKNVADEVTASGTVPGDVKLYQNARATLADKNGVITGSMLSPATLEGRKAIAQLFGFSDKAAENTDTLFSQLQETILPKLKTVYPASDKDVQLLEHIQGASQDLTSTTIRRIIDKAEVAARVSADRAIKKAQKVVDGTVEPAAKQHLQTLLDANKPDIPAYDDAYLGSVDPEDLAALKKGDVSPEDFDQVYGPGAAEQLLGAK